MLRQFLIIAKKGRAGLTVPIYVPKSKRQSELHRPSHRVGAACKVKVLVPDNGKPSARVGRKAMGPAEGACFPPDRQAPEGMNGLEAPTTSGPSVIQVGDHASCTVKRAIRGKATKPFAPRIRNTAEHGSPSHDQRGRPSPTRVIPIPIGPHESLPSSPPTVQWVPARH